MAVVTRATPSRTGARRATQADEPQGRKDFRSEVARMDLERCLGEPGDQTHCSNVIHPILTLE